MKGGKNREKPGTSPGRGQDKVGKRLRQMFDRFSGGLADLVDPGAGGSCLAGEWRVKLFGSCSGMSRVFFVHASQVVRKFAKKP
jgi:hypothetical protein